MSNLRRSLNRACDIAVSAALITVAPVAGAVVGAVALTTLAVVVAVCAYYNPDYDEREPLGGGYP